MVYSNWVWRTRDYKKTFAVIVALCVHSVVWCCWLVDRKGIWPAKTASATYPKRFLSGATAGRETRRKWPALVHVEKTSGGGGVVYCWNVRLSIFMFELEHWCSGFLHLLWCLYYQAGNSVLNWPRATDALCNPPFPQIDIIGAVVIVWRARGKIIRSFLCIIVFNNCTQWTAHTFEQT